MKSLSKRIRAQLARLAPETVRYLIAGAATTLLDLGLFALLTRLGMGDRTANALSIVAAVIFAYAANKLFVFRRHVGTFSALAAEFFMFILGRAATALLEYFGYPVILRIMGERRLIAKAMIIIVVLILNYIFSKLVVFSERSGGADEQTK